MAEGKVELEIVTPKGRALTVSADEVTVPSVDGEFGVMPGHVPVLAAVRTGIVSFRIGNETTRCAVSSGFAEAGDDRVVLLVDDYAEKDTLDPVLLKKELTVTEAAFEKASSADTLLDENEAERRVLIGKLNWLVTQLELGGEPPIASIRLLEEFGVRAPGSEDPDAFGEDDEEAGAEKAS